MILDFRSRGKWSRYFEIATRWCEGLIAAGTGSSGVVKALFSQVREGFLREGNAYQAALVSLDVAGV